MKQYIIPPLIVAALIGLLAYSPYYLTCSEPPVESDVVILLLGPDYGARKKEARKLILEGYSHILIVPAYGKILKSTGNGDFTLLGINSAIRNDPSKNSKAKKNFQFYEDTHLEILRAKTIMDNMGLKSANFVSSPYHMRRIKLIAGQVFKGGKYNFSFVPTRYEKTSSSFWLLHKFDLKWVLSEYLKIAWLIVYMPFTN